MESEIFRSKNKGKDASLAEVSRSTISTSSDSTTSSESDSGDLKYTELRDLAGPKRQDSSSKANVTVAMATFANAAVEAQNSSGGGGGRIFRQYCNAIFSENTFNYVSQQRMQALRKLARNFATFTTQSAHQLMEGLFFVGFWILAMFFMVTLHLFSTVYNMSSIPSSVRRTRTQSPQVTRRSTVADQTSARKTGAPSSKSPKLQRSATVEIDRKPRARSSSASSGRRGGSLSSSGVAKMSSSQIDVTPIRISPPRKTPAADQKSLAQVKGRVKQTVSTSRIPKACAAKKSIGLSERKTMKVGEKNADKSDVKRSSSLTKKSTMISLPRLVKQRSAESSPKAGTKRGTTKRSVRKRSPSPGQRVKGHEPHAQVVAKNDSGSTVVLAITDQSTQSGTVGLAADVHVVDDSIIAYSREQVDTVNLTIPKTIPPMPSEN